MPPMLASLGPITDWLSSRRIGAFSAKYDEVSQASSAAKVCHRTSGTYCNACRCHEQLHCTPSHKHIQELQAGLVLGCHAATCCCCALHTHVR